MQSTLFFLLNKKNVIRQEIIKIIIMDCDKIHQ